jgi:hypothetical protein
VLRDLDDTSPSTLTTGSAGDDDPNNTEDHDTQRIRSFLKRTVLLTKEAQEELAKRTEYLCMLKRHYESTANLHKLMRGLRLDSWFWMCERWQDVTRQYCTTNRSQQCNVTRSCRRRSEPSRLTSSLAAQKRTLAGATQTIPALRTLHDTQDVEHGYASARGSRVVAPPRW